MAQAVGASLATLSTSVKVDEGAMQLARRYAALIDAAAPSAAYVKHLRAIREAFDCMHVHGVTVMGVDYEKAFEAVTVALSAHTVASDLGPKLLAVLTSLGLTPAGRGVKGGATGVKPVSASATDELRQRRASRAERAGTDGA